MSAFQEEIISDSEVDFSEYERAVTATTQCIEGAGVRIVGPYLESEGLHHGVFRYYGGQRDKSKFYAWGLVAPTTEGLDAALAVDEECRAEYLDAVEWLYALLNTPTEKEVEAYYVALEGCLVAKGIDIGDGSRESIDDAATANGTSGCG